MARGSEVAPLMLLTLASLWLVRFSLPDAVTSELGAGGGR